MTWLFSALDLAIMWWHYRSWGWHQHSTDPRQGPGGVGGAPDHQVGAAGWRPHGSRLLGARQHEVPPREHPSLSQNLQLGSQPPKPLVLKHRRCEKCVHRQNVKMLVWLSHWFVVLSPVQLYPWRVATVLLFQNGKSVEPHFGNALFKVPSTKFCTVKNAFYMFGKTGIYHGKKKDTDKRPCLWVTITYLNMKGCNDTNWIHITHAGYPNIIVWWEYYFYWWQKPKLLQFWLYNLFSICWIFLYVMDCFFLSFLLCLLLPSAHFVWINTV